MEKIINIGGKDIKFVSNAAALIEYRFKFGGDMMHDMTAIMNASAHGDTLPEGAVETCYRAAYIMAKEADEGTTDDFKEWLKNFEMFDLINALPDLMELWGASNKSLSTQKKSGAR